MFRFQPIEQSLSSPELGGYRAYGIQAFVTTPTGCEEAGFVSDVSCDLVFTARLAETCEQLQLDPVHLMDVILDALP